MESPVPSPCISVCKMNASSGWCEGCWRSIDEIARWSQMGEDEKRAVWAQLARTQRFVITAPESASTMRVLERGWVSSNNVLLFDDDDSATLVDTGYVTHSEQTLALVRHALEGRRLARIINTHLHSDHCGGNALLSRELDAAITIPPGHAEAVDRWDDAMLGYSACGQTCDRFSFDSVLRPGERTMIGGAEWQALASPGHDPHSIILWNAEDRTLISADALWEHGFGAIFPEVEGESGFAEQRAILELISQIKPRLVIPGHGAPFTEVDQSLETRIRTAGCARVEPGT